MAADGTFFFDTNISEVVNQIKAGLTSIIGAQKDLAAGAGDTAGAKNLQRAMVEANEAVQRTGASFTRLSQAITSGTQISGSFTNNLRRGAEDLDRELGRILGKRGISIDVAFDVRKDSIREVNELANRLASGARKTDIDPAVIGTGRISSARSNFQTGLDQGAEDRQGLSERNDFRRRRSAAANRSARAAEQEATADERAAADARAAEESRSRALRDTRRSEIAAARLARATPEPSSRAADFSQPAPPVKVRATKAVASEEPAQDPLEYIREQLTNPARSAQDQSRLDAELSAAKQRYIDRLRSLGRPTGDEHLDPDAILAEYLRGATASGRSRTGGFAPGVDTFGRQTVDTRFGSTDLFSQSAKGNFALVKDSEEFRRAQEALGAALAKDTESTFTATQKIEAQARAVAQAAAARDNADRIRQNVRPGDKFSPGVFDQGGGLLSDQSQGKLEFLQKQTDGSYRKLSEGTGEYLDAMAKYTAALSSEAEKASKARERLIQQDATARQRAATKQAEADARLAKAGADADAKALRARDTLQARQQVNDTIKAGALPGQRFADGVVELPGNRAVDTRGATPIPYERASDGLFQVVAQQDKAVVALRDFTEQTRKAGAGLDAKRLADQRRDNLADLRKGAASGQVYAPGVRDLGAGFLADERKLDQGILNLYHRAGEGFDNLAEKEYLYAQAEERRLAQRNAERAAALARSNADRILDVDQRSGLANKAKNGFEEGSLQFGQNSFTVLEDGVRKFYKRVADGLQEVPVTSPEYQKEFQAFERSGVGGRGILGSFVHGATSGGFGGNGVDGLQGLAQAAGTTAKYTALYSVLGALQGLLARTGQEIVNFEDSNTNLQIALEQTTQDTGKAADVTQDYINSLENISIAAGANVGDIQDVVASGIRTIGLNSAYSTEQVKILGEEFALQAQRMAVLGKTDITDAAGNLRAISNAFDVPIENSSRINDALVTGKNIGGGDEQQTAQAVASAGEALKSAGFSLEQSFTIASRIQAATDQSGAAVGNKLARIVSIVSGSAGQKALTDLNESLTQGQIKLAPKIDLGAGVETQLRQLSAIYEKAGLSEAQRKPLINSLGGTSSAKEILTILESYNKLVDGSSGSLNNAGAAAKEYQRRLEDLSQVVREFQGSISALIVNIGNSGLLDPLLFGFKVLTETLKGLADAFGIFNTIPGAIRRTTIGLAEAAIAYTLFRKVAQQQGIGGFLTGLEKTFRPQAAVAREQLGKGAGLAETGAAVTEATITAGRTATVAVTQGAVTAAATAAAEIKSLIASTAFTTAGQVAATAEAAGATVAAEVAAAAQAAAAGAAAAGIKGAAVSGAAGAAGDAFASRRALHTGVEVGKDVAEASAATAAVSAVTKPGLLARVGSFFGLRAGGAAAGAAAAGASEAGAGAAAGAAAGAGAGATALGLIGGPVGAAILAGVAGFAALGSIKGRSDEVSQAMRGATRSLGDFQKTLETNKSLTPKEQLENLRNSASASATARLTLQQQTSGLGGLFASDQNRNQIEALRDAEATATQQANDLENQILATGQAYNKTGKFGDQASRTVESVNTELDNLTNAGFSSTQRMKELISTLGLLPDGSNKKIKGAVAGANADGQRTVTTKKRDVIGDPITDVTGIKGLFTNATGLTATATAAAAVSKAAASAVNDLSSIAGSLPDKVQTQRQVPIALGPTGGLALTQSKPSDFPNLPTTTITQDIDNPLATQLAKNSGKYGALVTAAIGKKTKAANLSDKDIGAAALAVETQVTKDYLAVYETLTPDEKNNPAFSPNKIGKDAGDKVAASLRGQRSAAALAAGQTQSLTTSQALVNIQGLQTAASAEQQGLAGNTGAQIVAGKRELRAIQSEIDNTKTGENIAGLIEQYQSVEREVVAKQNAQGEAIRKAAQSKTKSAAEIRKIGEAFFRDAVARTADAGDEDALIDLFNEANTAEVAEARAVLVKRIAQLKAKNSAEAKTNAAIQTARDLISSVANANAQAVNHNYAPTDESAYGITDQTRALAATPKTKKNAAAVKRAQAALKAFDAALKQATPDKNGLGSIATGADSTTVDPTELAIAQRNVNALSGAKLDAAARAVKDARSRVAKTGQNALELAQAQKALNEALYDQSQAQLNYANVAAQLKIDLTDPVAVAKIARDTAKRAYQQAVKDAKTAGLKGRKRDDFLAPFLIDQRQTQASFENTSTSTYLSDLKTSLDVGRITHAAYINNLKAKREQLKAEQLESDKNTTGFKQRQAAIDNITSLIKGAASELSGMFNIGDIKIPTIYQVRRSLNAQLPGDILKSNPALSTAGNVTNDTSTKNVILNGVPVEQILTMIQDLFGVKARTSASRRIKSA